MRTRASLLLACILSLGGLTVAAAAVPAQAAATRPHAASIAPRMPRGLHTVKVWRVHRPAIMRDGKVVAPALEITCDWGVSFPYVVDGYVEDTSDIICDAVMTSLYVLADLSRNGKLVAQGDSFNKGKQGVAETVKYNCNGKTGGYVDFNGSMVGTATFPPPFEPSPQTKTVTGATYRRNNC